MRFGLGRRFVVAGFAGCALVVLGAAGASAAKPHSSGDAEATLTVTITGTGTGVIQSTPQGINCSTVCSAQFPVNTDVSLRAQSTTSSGFAGWSNVSGSDCVSMTHGGVGANYCETNLEGDTVVKATFNTKPPPCTAPGVTYTNLTIARRLIESHNCKIGKITYAVSRKKKGRVLAQNPNAHWHRENGAIDLVVSKGKP
jgi:hypothetical protein